MGRKLRRLLKWSVTAVVVIVSLAVVALFVAYWMSDNECPPEAAAEVAMNAIVYCNYGGPEVLDLRRIEKPVPQPDQVLVRVHAASVNPLELHYMRGTPYVMRLDGGLRKPKVTRLGVDFAGTVEAVGSAVTDFKPGDAVFGGRTGSYAEYLAVRAASIVKKPDGISFEEAAVVPIAGLTALQAVRDHGKVRAGQRVLINGASGGVGTFAVQIAKSLGAHVTGVCSTRNVALVRSLGADQVVDYTREDFTEGKQPYDVIIDMVGNHSLREYRRVLKPDGIYVMVGGPKGRWIAPIDRVARMAVVAPFVSQKFGMMLSKLNRDDLAVLAGLMTSGKVRPVIDRRYPLARVPEAIRYLETGRARGKVVITIAE